MLHYAVHKIICIILSQILARPLDGLKRALKKKNARETKVTKQIEIEELLKEKKQARNIANNKPQGGRNSKQGWSTYRVEPVESKEGLRKEKG